MIQVHSLSKHYGTFKAVDSLSFHIEKGEIVGFLGPNGAGKSTTMKILSSVLPASSGEASVAGFNCQTEPLEVRKRIGYVPENIPLYGDMTPRELLGFVARIKGVAGKDISREISEVEGLFQVTPFCHKLIRSLSKGQRQRVGVAQALLGNPELLILDEPSVGLDPAQIHEMREIIKGMQGKRTVLLSTHILPEVSMSCQRIIIINKGKIVAEESTGNLLARFNKQERLEVQAEGSSPSEIKQLLRSVAGVSELYFPETQNKDVLHFEVETAPSADDKEIRRAISHAVVSAGFGLLHLSSVNQGKSLEDIFLELVTTDEPSSLQKEAS